MAWAQGRRAAAYRRASGPASDIGHDRPGREIRHRESWAAIRPQFRRVLEVGASCDYLLGWACVPVELAEKGLAILVGRVCQLLDKAFDLLASGLFEFLGTAEVNGIGFDQFRIQLVLANDLAEPVANLMTGTVTVSIGGFGRELR